MRDFGECRPLIDHVVRPTRTDHLINDGILGTGLNVWSRREARLIQELACQHVQAGRAVVAAPSIPTDGVKVAIAANAIGVSRNKLAHVLIQAFALVEEVTNSVVAGDQMGNGAIALANPSVNDVNGGGGKPGKVVLILVRPLHFLRI